MNNPIPVNLAVEDSLSDAVCRKLLLDSGKTFAIGVTFSQGGYGYLRKTIKGFNRAARGTPFLILTDLDNGECAPELQREWLNVERHPNLIFRVAVREVESWLLGHRKAFAGFLGIPQKLIPRAVDELNNPKQFLFTLVSKSRKREIRRDLLPRKNSTSKQGPNYNSRLIEFVQEYWDPTEASKSSDSLHRALTDVGSFEPTWQQED